ncbi:MAG: DUF4124 domain-containing protein [Gallionella sp.]|jgi:hypothetical protein
MKFGCLLLCLIPSLALADIYKSVDADGHVTYSSAPIKGGKRVVLTPLPVVSAPARTSNSPQDFPKVDKETQKGRDSMQRKVLEDELKAEEDLLGGAQQSLKLGEAARPKDDEKIKALTRQVDLHQRNINALKIELSKLK